MTHRYSVNVLGVPVSAWRVESLVEAMLTSVNGTTPGERLTTVLYANVHVLNLAYTDKHLRAQLCAASTVYCDGSGVRLGAALLGHNLPPRLTAADWISVLCQRAVEEGLALYLIGGADGVSTKAAGILAERHPGLRVAGAHHGFLNDESSDELIRDVNASGAGIVLLGMGTPVQELWLSRHRQNLEAPVVWAVGALFDFVAGVQRRAPGWIRNSGLEWLWRLGTDPARLAGRYLLGNPLFILRVLRQRFFGLPRVISQVSRQV